MVAKEIPTSGRFTDMDYDLNIDNPVETSLSLGSLADVVAGGLRRGDEIAISVINSSNQEFNGVVLSHILIKQAYTADGVQLNVGDSGQATMFVVILSQQDEQTLNQLLNSGGSLRIAKTNNVKY
jgi:hypothetical protein